MLLKKKLKKNLTLLIALVALSSNCFSQTDTLQERIVLTKPIAKLVVKDLISGDQLKLELETTLQVLEQTNFKLNTQTNLVTNLQGQITNYESIVGNLENKFNTQQKLSDDLQAALKAANRKTKLYKIGTYVGAGALLLLLAR
tara:strand:+ start:268 stop:696 length:429 start_codon:yes stop_codon:yes gene_type:complete